MGSRVCNQLNLLTELDPNGARVSATDEAIQLALTAAHAASDKLATDIVILDVSERLAITDLFVIATGSNERQVEAIVDSVEERLRKDGRKPIRREGARDGRWVLLDFSDIVVHVQHTEERAFYALERLWKDCPVIPFNERSREDNGLDDRAPQATENR